MPKTARTWTGARTPSGLKRVRQAEARRDVLQPRRSAAKTLVAKALRVSAQPNNGSDANVALLEALSALDRAAKSGAIHPNAAARRKSRLTRLGYWAAELLLVFPRVYGDWLGLPSLAATNLIIVRCSSYEANQ